MRAMQRLEGKMRRAMQMYHMIEAGDSICVGVSGGKDSMALAVGLANLSKYYDVPFTVYAVTLDPGFGGMETDYSAVTAVFEKYNVKHIIQRTNIGHVVFETRKEPNPCALCANLRRGSLHTIAKELGCNKVALGHHLDDAIETFYMNLFREGRIGCFSPKTWLSRREITLIRPLLFATEQEVINAVTSMGLPIVKSTCPVDDDTARAVAKKFVTTQCLEDAAFRQKTLGAMQKAGIDGWAPQL